MINHLRRACCLTFVAAATILVGGCAGDFTAGAAPLERTVDPVLVQAHPRMGKVYCTRGFLGIFSTGMMDLADRINSEVGVTAVSIADQEYTRLQDWIIEEHKKGSMGREPLVLLGHSYGADDMIRVAERLKKEDITVDLLILIDPVTQPAIPNNVKRVYCVYKSRPLTDGIPAWRGVAATVADPATPIENVDLRTAQVDFPTEEISHPQIDKNVGVQNLAIEQIKKTCPPRPGFAAGNKTVTTPPKP
jgi:hypothetical protein